MVHQGTTLISNRRRVRRDERKEDSKGRGGEEDSKTISNLYIIPQTRVSPIPSSHKGKEFK